MSEYQRHSASAVSNFIAASSCLARASSGSEILVPLSLCLVPQVSTPCTSYIGPVLIQPTLMGLPLPKRFAYPRVSQLASMGNTWYTKDMELVLRF